MDCLRLEVVISRTRHLKDPSQLELGHRQRPRRPQRQLAHLKWLTPDRIVQALAWLPFSPSLASVSFQDFNWIQRNNNPIVKLSHFFFLPGNAEITDLFRCPSSKVVCCAQKSAIRELKPPSSISAEAPHSEFSRYCKQTMNLNLLPILGGVFIY